MSTRVVIEIDQDVSEAQLKRMLKDANRRQDTEPADHWIDLDTPFIRLSVSKVVGLVSDRTGTVIEDGEKDIFQVVPL